MNNKQKQLVEMVRLGMVQVPVDSESLAIFLEKSFGSTNDLSSLRSIASCSHDEDVLLKKSVRAYLRAIGRVANKSKDGFVYVSVVRDYLKRRVYANELAEIMRNDGKDIMQQLGASLLNTGLIEFKGGKVKMTLKGVDVDNKNKEEKGYL